MKLIVEGPDGGGKTAVIEKLGLTRRHFKSLRGGVGGADFRREGKDNQGWADPLDHPAVAYLKQLVNAPDGTAFDRFYLSERVYGPILREGSAISQGHVDIVQEIARVMRIPTVICLPPFETTLRNVIQPGRERPTYQTEAFLRTAYDAWVELTSSLRCFDYVVFNYETTTLDALRDTLEVLTGDYK